MSDFKNGTYKYFYLFVDGEYYPVGCLTSTDFSESSDMLDTTTRQNAGGWATSKPTLQRYSISISGLVTTNDKEGAILTYNDLQGYKRNKTQLNWKSNTEQTGYSDFGLCYITSLSQTASVDENISFTAEIVGYGIPVTQLDTQENLNYTLNFNI